MNRSQRATLVVLAIAFVSAVVPSAHGQTVTSPTQAGTVQSDDLINPDRPGIADGSSVIGRGRFQLETGLQYEFRNSGGDDERTVFIPTLFRVGLADRLEARFEGNTFTTTDSGPDRVVAVAPVSFGMKFQIQDSAGVRHPSLGAIVRIFPASGSGSLHTNRLTGDVRLAADWDLTSRVSINPNAGLAFYEDDADGRFLAGLFATTLNYFNATKTINPFLDVGLQAPEGSQAGTAVILDGGLAYLPGRNVQVDVSAGTGVHGRTPPQLFFSIGVSLRFHAS